jgi:hypothetical protein
MYKTVVLSLLLILLTITGIVYEFISSRVFAEFNSSSRQEVRDIIREEIRSLFTNNSISSSFPPQSLSDMVNDFIMTNATKQVNTDYQYIDISSVDYTSNGRFLNATLWMTSPIYERPPKDISILTYGMIIDASQLDNSQYQVEISWENETKTWTRTLSELSSAGGSRILEAQYNYSAFFNRIGSSGEVKSLLLTADTSNLFSSSNRYKVMFYADMKKETTDLVRDLTKCVNIPPIELSLFTLPSFTVLKPGEEKSIALQVKTATNLNNPLVSFSSNLPDGINATFIPPKMYIPDDGEANLALNLTAERDVVIRPYLFSVSANLSDEAVFNKNVVSNRTPLLCEGTENTLKTSTLALTTVLEEKPNSEVPTILSLLATQQQNFQQLFSLLVAAIISALGAWLFKGVVANIIKRKKGKHEY